MQVIVYVNEEVINGEINKSVSISTPNSNWNDYFETLDDLALTYKQPEYVKYHIVEHTEIPTEYRESWEWDDETNSIIFNETKREKIIKTQKGKSDKYITYDKYCNEDIEDYPFSDTVNIEVTTENLLKLNQKMNGWNETNEYIPWKEGDNWIQLTKIKLQEILTYAETLKQEKFEEIFGLEE